MFWLLQVNHKGWEYITLFTIIQEPKGRQISSYFFLFLHVTTVSVHQISIHSKNNRQHQNSSICRKRTTLTLNTKILLGTIICYMKTARKESRDICILINGTCCLWWCVYRLGLTQIPIRGFFLTMSDSTSPISIRDAWSSLERSCVYECAERTVMSWTQ